MALEREHDNDMPHADLGGRFAWRVDFSSMEQRNTGARSTGSVRQVRRTVLLTFTEEHFGLQMQEQDTDGYECHFLRVSSYCR